MPVYDMETLSKLLAKAEGTNSSAESEMFMERAEKIAAAIGVNLDVARAYSISKETQKPEERRYTVGSYGGKLNNFKVELFLAIAGPYDLLCAISGKSISVWGTGYPSDHEIVNALFQVAVVRMVGDADKAIKRGDQKYSGVDGRLYRASFYEGFINTLRSRLWEEKREARLAWETEHPPVEGEEGPSMALVLADKKKSVEDAYREANPHFYHPDGSHKTGAPVHQGPEVSRYVRGAASAGETSAKGVRLTTEKGVNTGIKGALS